MTYTQRMLVLGAVMVAVFAVAHRASAAFAPRSCSAFELDALRFQPPRVHSWRSLATTTTRTCNAVGRRYGWLERQAFPQIAAVVDEAFPGTGWWLVSCNATEGGPWGWVMNTAGSGAGGPMQFMESTFYAHSDLGLAEGRARGLVHLPAWTNDWHSRLGQAVVAASMYPADRVQWTGAGC